MRYVTMHSIFLCNPTNILILGLATKGCHQYFFCQYFGNYEGLEIIKSIFEVNQMSLNIFSKYVSIRRAENALITLESCLQVLKYSYNVTTHL